ncbi:Adenylate kinase 3, partial [Diplonema papillatum]
VSTVLALQVPDSVLEERICGRWIHKASGRSYHVKFAPPKSLPAGAAPCADNMQDDETGDPLTQRSDDTSAALRTRLESYHSETVPLLKHYELVVHAIQANVDVEDIWKNIVSHLGITEMTSNQSLQTAPSVRSPTGLGCRKAKASGSKKILVLFGPPGSGKGTQGAKLAECLRIAKLSMGEMLREAVVNESEEGIRAKTAMLKGRLVSDDVVVNVVKNRIQKPDCEAGFILDGFPRTEHQAEVLDGILSATGDSVTNVVSLEIPDGALQDRITGRWLHSKSGRSYHASFNPPVSLPAGAIPTKQNMLDDQSGDALMQRSDDTPVVLQTRLKAFHAQAKPVLAWYQHCTVTVNACQDVLGTWSELAAKLKLDQTLKNPAVRQSGVLPPHVVADIGVKPPGHGLKKLPPLKRTAIQVVKLESWHFPQIEMTAQLKDSEDLFDLVLKERSKRTALAAREFEHRRRIVMRLAVDANKSRQKQKLPPLILLSL